MNFLLGLVASAFDCVLIVTILIESVKYIEV